MRMLGALVEIQVVDELRTKTVLREHSLYCHPDQLCRLLGQNLFRSAETLSSRIASVTDIDPVGHLSSCELHLVCIEDDDIVTAVNVRGEVWLVLDATTGQNGISQAKIFLEATDVSGIVLTKMDGTAKGGVVLAIRDLLHLPVRFLGLGEKPEDLKSFDINAFLMGITKGMDSDE